MKTTRYFVEQVTRKRPYLTIEMCIGVVESPIERAEQADGRIRHWGKVHLPNEQDTRILRVVTLEDGETLHNAFLDRGFREDD